MVGKIAETLGANRDAYGEIALANSGNTKTDAAIDIDGAIGTAAVLSRARPARWARRASLRDGGLIRMGRDEAFQALHVGVPLRGVAIRINAFNFPAWGLWEKAAVALLAGVPVLAKPATSTAWLAQRMVEDVVKAGAVPEGALSDRVRRRGRPARPRDRRRTPSPSPAPPRRRTRSAATGA